MKRIGIFQYEWPLRIHTLNLASSLAKNGFQVDLYLYECDTSFVDLSNFIAETDVRVFNFARSFPQKIFDRLRSEALRMCGYKNEVTVRDTIVAQAIECIGETRYDYFIGIEKKGLIWSGSIADVFGTPFLYYSLELYVENDPEFVSRYNFPSLRAEERKYHASSICTIVQDAARAAVLLESNGIKNMDLIYFPVSVSGQAIRNKGRFLYDRLSIDTSKKIILYFGIVCGDRGMHDLLKQADRLDESFVLVLHGPVFTDITTEELHSKGVIFSRDIIDNSEIPDMIASAHIGLAFYRNDIINDRLTAFSSEKIARYMQLGLPIIAYANESYELLMKHYHCGELIDHMSQLPEMACKIDFNYDHYRNNAFSAFEKYYSCDENMHAVYAYLRD